jgi:hypothetical protein
MVRTVRLEEAQQKTGKAKTTSNQDDNRSERQIIGEMIGDVEVCNQVAEERPMSGEPTRELTEIPAL